MGPCLQVEIGWRRRWTYVVHPRQTYTSHVAREQFTGVCVEEDHVMYCVSRRIMHLQASTCNMQCVAPFEDMQPFLRGRLNLAPQRVHTCSVDACCTRYYPRRVKQVRRTLAVYIHLCSGHAANKRPGSTCMIQVHMGSQDVRDIFRLKACLANRCQ